MYCTFYCTQLVLQLLRDLDAGPAPSTSGSTLGPELQVQASSRSMSAMQAGMQATSMQASSMSRGASAAGMRQSGMGQLTSTSCNSSVLLSPRGQYGTTPGAGAGVGPGSGGPLQSQEQKGDVTVSQRRDVSMADKLLGKLGNLLRH